MRIKDTIFITYLKQLQNKAFMGSNHEPDQILLTLSLNNLRQIKKRNYHIGT